MISSFNFNWYGAYTLYIREVRRFLRVYHQTVVAPAVSALIFLSIFVLALGDNKANIHGIPFINFMGYGLIIMSVIQNAFANSSSSLIMARMIGYINDILMPPFNGIELVTAYVMGALTRGIIVGILVAVFLIPFIDFSLYHPLVLIYYTFSACILLGLLGIISAIIVSNFDQNSAITSYVIMPLSFLSGTFYSVDKLPHIFQVINHFNPFFYIIDGFRYSLTGYADGNIAIGSLALLVLNLVMYYITVKIIDSGWRLKS